MSRLRVYWPDAVSDAEELIVPFTPLQMDVAPERTMRRPQLPSRSSRFPQTTIRAPHFLAASDSYPTHDAVNSSVLDRARTLYLNRCCPDCSHPIVEPVELDDAMVNRNGQPIPGTATLIGFRCDACDNEWPAR